MEHRGGGEQRGLDRVRGGVDGVSKRDTSPRSSKSDPSAERTCVACSLLFVLLPSLSLLVAFEIKARVCACVETQAREETVGTEKRGTVGKYQDNLSSDVDEPLP